MSKNQEAVQEIIGKHLGSKQGDYSAYTDITEVRPDLLVAVPRQLNRADINFPAVCAGTDVWHGWEVSALLDNGFPCAFVAVLTFDSDSPNLIESKSMKLYWNTYNMARMGQTIAQVENNIIKRATEDLSEAAGSRVYVQLYSASKSFGLNPYDQNSVQPAELKYANVLNDIDPILEYGDSKTDSVDQLVSVRGVRELNFSSSLLRSNCRITKQPDFADIFITMAHLISGPEKLASVSLPTELSLLRYIVSMRNIYKFHEETVEAIFADLYNRYKPGILTVTALYTRRGGWDICPMRSIKTDFGTVASQNPEARTPRQ